MSVLGNLLRRAFSVVPPVRLEYRTVSGHSTNSIGNTIMVYSDWVSITGMVEPGVSSSFGSGKNLGEMELKAAGIDFSHDVVSVWIRNDIIGIKGKTAPSQIKYHGRVYNVKNVANWYEYDGWKRLVCEEDIREEDQ